MHYSGLVVIDARGRELPATLAGVAGDIRITVDDSGARYPIGGSDRSDAGRSVESA